MHISINNLESFQLFINSPLATNGAWVLITPEIRKFLLSKNTGNRPIHHRVVQKYAETMKNNLWKPSPEPIILGTKLLEGQHRLYASEISNTTFVNFVIANMPDDIFDVLGTGSTRSPYDIVGLLGQKKYKRDISSAIRCILNYKDGIKWLNQQQSNAKIGEFYVKNLGGILESLEIAKLLRQIYLTPLSVGIFLHFVTIRTNPQKGKELFEILLNANHPKIASAAFFANFLGKSKSEAKMSLPIFLLKCLKCIKLFFEGKTITKVYLADADDYNLGPIIW